ncbi:MAG: glycosyltransferase family 4 protein [candidate division Zixibacteria bacterium]|nr:glycosyltransferase family 4 protein [candidate division Zixibacteria bacterium]
MSPNRPENRRPKIIFFAGGYHLSGASRSLWELLKGLDQSKYEIKLNSREYGPLEELLRKNGIEVKTFPLIRKLYEPGNILLKIIRRLWTNLILTVQIYVYLKKEQPALAYFSTIEPRYAVPAVSLCRVPLIWHLREYRSGKFKQWLFSRLIDTFSDRIILSSLAVKREYFSGYKENGKMTLIYNGVDLNRIDELKSQPTNLIPAGRAPLIGFFGLLNPIKGVHILILAVEKLQADFPGLLCLIVGKEDLNHEKYAQSLKEMVRTKRLDRQIIFTGYVENVFPVMDKLDLMVIPSFADSCNRAILEGMALKKPVVATNVGGNPELVVDGQTGKLVPSGNAEMLTDAIRLLLENKEMRRAMGEMGRKRIEEMFRTETYRKKVEAVIQSTLADE